jgi:hypothetical protein
VRPSGMRLDEIPFLLSLLLAMRDPGPSLRHPTEKVALSAKRYLMWNFLGADLAPSAPLTRSHQAREGKSRSKRIGIVAESEGTMVGSHEKNDSPEAKECGRELGRAGSAELLAEKRGGCSRRHQAMLRGGSVDVGGRLSDGYRGRVHTLRRKGTDTARCERRHAVGLRTGVSCMITHLCRRVRTTMGMSFTFTATLSRTARARTRCT